MRKVLVEKATRLEKIPPYPLFNIQRALKRLEKKGVELIDLGRFDPVLPLFDSVQKLFTSNPENGLFGYAKDEEVLNLKGLFSSWFKKRYGVFLNPKTEIHFYTGKRETIAQLALYLINPKDKIYLCEPASQLYKSSALLADGEIEIVPLLERNDYLPNVAPLKDKNKDRGKYFFLNYPHNPTGSLADLFFYRELVDLALKNNIKIVQDASYNEVYFDQYQPPSLLEVKEGKRVGVEVHSVSISAGLPGMDCGFLVGNKEIISAMESQSKLFSQRLNRFTLKLTEALLVEYEVIIEKNREEYKTRRDIVTEILLNLGWRSRKSKATPFFWAQIPVRYSSLGFCRMLLRRSGVLACPGIEYGEQGEGFIRLSLNQPVEKLKQAGERIRDHIHIWQKKYRR